MEVRCETQDDEYTITVSDNGSGIPPNPMNVSSGCSSAPTARTIPELESGWPYVGKLSSGTAGVSGSSRRPAKVRSFDSRFHHIKQFDA